MYLQHPTPVDQLFYKYFVFKCIHILLTGNEKDTNAIDFVQQ